MPTSTTLTIRRAADRGLTTTDWLEGRHSFSFGHYHDQDNMGFRALRVINDDIVAPGGGFGRHPHRDMEILTWVIEGGLEHGDSLGNGDVIRPGDVQAMTAGSGIFHQEFNASSSEPVRLLQIWIEPRETGLEPTYTQRAFPAQGRKNAWQLLASGDAAADGLHINQDAEVFVADIDAGASLQRIVDEGRFGYIQVAYGELTLNDHQLSTGDGVRVARPMQLSLTAGEDSQVLFFDLA